MRYLYSISVIILLTSFFIVFQFVLNTKTPLEPALIINDRIVSVEELNQLKQLQPDDVELPELISSIITEEVLLQEAQKKQIDKEESFRKAIQDFYEKSLIKILKDRKFSSLKISVSDNEIETYKRISNYKFELTEFQFESLSDTLTGKYADGEQKTYTVSELPIGLLPQLQTLSSGKFAKPVFNTDHYSIFRVDNITETVVPINKRIQANYIRRKLIDKKKSSLIDEWIYKLKMEATVEIRNIN